MASLLTDIEQQVEDFFQISALKCSCCDELRPEAPDWGIGSPQEWEGAMKERIAWLKVHREEVLLHLARLRSQWPKSCESLEAILS